MKNVIGTIKIRECATRLHTLNVYVKQDLINLLGDKIVFNYRQMTIKRPTIDSKRTLSIKACQFTFNPTDMDIEEFFGLYNVILEDEDTFKLKKIR